jgi:hypothetical protein
VARSHHPHALELPAQENTESHPVCILIRLLMFALGSMYVLTSMCSEVLEQAQGEVALEEYLADVNTKWEAFRLELVDYRGKSFLIRNYDPLFELVCESTFLCLCRMLCIFS